MLMNNDILYNINLEEDLLVSKLLGLNKQSSPGNSGLVSRIISLFELAQIIAVALHLFVINH